MNRMSLVGGLALAVLLALVPAAGAQTYSTGNDVAEFIPTQVGKDLNLDLNEGPGDDDRPRILSISATIEVPGVRRTSRRDRASIELQALPRGGGA